MMERTEQFLIFGQETVQSMTLFKCLVCLPVAFRSDINAGVTLIK